MESKWNNGLLFLLLFQALLLQGQSETDSMGYDESEETEIQGNYDPYFHYHDSEQQIQNQQTFEPAFDLEYWKTLVKDKNFDEEKDSTKKAEKKSPINKKSKINFLEYLWILPVLLILILLLMKFVPLMGLQNVKNKNRLIIRTDHLDEEELKALEIEEALRHALEAGNYRLAYRLRYLNVLKQLIDKNLVIYKKEKTNYEYLMQLAGKPVYEAFGMLTLNFDGIWYGELALDRSQYESLGIHFQLFEKQMKEI